MSSFVYDETDLPFPKSDARALDAGADPDKNIVADDWNAIAQAEVDLRDALLVGNFFGMTEQTTAPATPANYGARLFVRSNGIASPGTKTQLCVKWSGGTITVIAESPAR